MSSLLHMECTVQVWDEPGVSKGKCLVGSQLPLVVFLGRKFQRGGSSSREEKSLISFLFFFSNKSEYPTNIGTARATPMAIRHKWWRSKFGWVRLL